MTLSVSPQVVALKQLRADLTAAPWPILPLGHPEVAEINPKVDLKSLDADTPVSFLPMEAVDENTNTFHPTVRPVVEVRKGYTAFADNDVIWAKITPCMQNGKSALVRGLTNGVGSGSTEFHVLRAGQKALPEFLWALLSMPRLLFAAQGAFAGSSGHQRVPASFLAELKIPVPDMAVQRELVAELKAGNGQRSETLESADQTVQQTEEAVATVLGFSLPKFEPRSTYAVTRSTAAASRLDANFHHPRYSEALRALNSGNGENLSIGDILLDISGGATPKAKDSSLYAASGVKFFRILNVKPNRLDFGDLNFVHEEVHEGLLKRSQLAVDDVLMTITGRVGTAAVVSKKDLPANINQHIVRMRIDKSRCLPRYLAAYLNTQLGTLLTNRPVSGGTRVALDYGAIRQMPILLPSMDRQKEVVRIVEEGLQREADLREQALSIWQAARQRFEDHLLNGVAS